LNNQQQSVARARGILLLPLVAKGLPIVVDGVKELIKKEQKKYTAEYALGRNNLYFYAAPSPNGMLDPRGIQFESLEIKRTVQVGPAADAVALRLQLTLPDDEASLYNLLNNSVFQLKLSDLELHYAKAKVPAAHWFMPWTLGYRAHDKVNLDVAVKFLGSWIGDDGTIHTSQTLGTALLTLRNVPINDPAALRTYEQQQRGKTLDGYFYLVPRSAGSYMSTASKEGDGGVRSDGITKGYGQGIYSVEATVVESGKSHLVNKVIGDNLDVLDQAPAAIMKKLK
jgi:hypothetical protein